MTEPPKPPPSKPEIPPESPPAKPALPREIGGPQGPEPTRYGDWERNGRVSDF
jgi:homeobox protein ESX1